VRRSSLSATSDESDIIAPMRKTRLTTPLGEDDEADLDEARGFTSDEDDDEYDVTDGFVVPDTDSDTDSGSSSDEQSSNEEIGSPYFMDDPPRDVDDWEDAGEDAEEERRLLRQQRLNTKHAFVRHPSKYVECESEIRGEDRSDDDEDEDEDAGVDSQDDENFINDHNAGILYLGYR